MALKYVFWAEFLINIPSFVMCLFLPAVFADQLTGLDAGPVLLDMIRWYGVVLFVLTFVLGKALLEKDLGALKTILMGYAIGDIIQIAVTWKLAQTIGGWNFSLVFTAVLSVFLCASRVAVLQNDRRLGY